MAPLTGGRTFQYSVSGTVTKDYLSSSNTVQTLSGPVTNATLTRVVTNVGTSGTATTYQFTDTLTWYASGKCRPSVESFDLADRQNPGQFAIVRVGKLGKFGYNATTAVGTGDPLAPATFTTSANTGGTSALNLGEPLTISIPPPDSNVLRSACHIRDICWGRDGADLLHRPRAGIGFRPPTGDLIRPGRP